MADAGAAAESNQPRFNIQRIYTKDISFESPLAPGVFDTEWKPAVEVHLESAANTLGEGIFEVQLSATVTAKQGEDIAFLVEVHQGGVFEIANVEEEQLGAIVGSTCPGILYPYVREIVSDVVARGGFPQLVLAPANFDAMYLQQRQQREASA